jgi:glycosyltransferase involved in cell wall biosynthesis
MENTLQESHTKASNFRIQVLLATFNGEKYLADFLESLIAQSGVTIELLVSDDGSTDRTLEILDEYHNCFPRTSIKRGPNNGASANFFSLIDIADADYVAFADQDDIWKPEHLINSINRLRSANDAALSFCSVSEFRGDSLKKNLWPKKYPRGKVFNVIAENYARGCTIVVNRKALNLLQCRTPKNAIMHDWWTLIVVQSVGQIFWSKLPEIEYRVHEKNSVGPTPSFLTRSKRFFNALKARDWAPLNQIEEAYNFYEGSMTEHDRHELGKWLSRATSPVLSQRLLGSLLPYRLRSNWFFELPVRIQILHGRK